MSRIIQTPKLYPHQKAVVNILDKYPHQNIKLVVKSSRQKGKSLLALLLLLREAVNNPGTTSILVEPTNTQNRRQFKDMTKMLNGCKQIVESANSSFLEISLLNGSQILFRSAEQRENLRGYTVTGILILDEAAFLGKDIEELVMPWCNVHKSNIVLFSTPKFKTGPYYNWYVRAMNGEKNCYLVDFNDYDTTELLSKEQLEEYRRTLAPTIFRSEYLGEFIEEGGTVFQDFSSLYNDAPTLTGKYYVGIDWGSGSGSDDTAVSIWNDLKQQVGLYYFNDIQPLEQIDKIVNILREFQPSNKGDFIKCTVELNSIGKIYFDMLRNKTTNIYNLSVNGFNTTNESKRKAIENFQLLMQNREINLLPDTKQSLELSCYEIQETATGKITYNNNSPEVHDDIVISDSIALWNLKKSKYVFI